MAGVINESYGGVLSEVEAAIAIAETLEGDLVTESREQAVIREKFTEELIRTLNLRQNYIESRAITNVQIAKVIETLENKNDTKHYYYRKKYYIVPGEVKKVAFIKAPDSTESEESVHRLIVSLEDMWAVLWKVHVCVNHNGRIAPINRTQQK